MCGDFNLDLNRVSANPKIRESLNGMSCYGVFPVVNICTRVTANSESLLDNIFCDIKYDSVSVVINDVSDHFGVLLCVNNFCTPKSKNSKTHNDRLRIDGAVLVRFKNELEKCKF